MAVLQRTTRRKVPLILQMEAAECGAACLAMVCAYWGKYVPLDQMRIQLGVSRDGASAGSIMRAAKRMGLECHAYRNMDAEKLRALEGPSILFWRGAHFVVLDGFEGDCALVNDPALGRRRVDADEFAECYSNVAMTFTPTESFELAPKERKLVPLVRRRMGSMWGVAALIMLSSVLLACVPAVLATLLELFFTSASDMEGVLHVERLAGAFVATMVVGFAVDVGRTALLGRLRNRLVLLSSHDFLKRLFQLPLVFFSQRFTGDVLARIVGNDRANVFLAEAIPGVFLDGVLLLTCAIALLMRSVWLFCLCVIVFALYALTAGVVLRRQSDEELRLQQEQGRLLGLVHAGLGARRSLKAAGAERAYEDRLVEVDARASELRRAFGRSKSAMAALDEIAPFALCALVAVTGTYAVLAGLLPVGAVAAAMLLSTVAFGALKGLLGFARSYSEALGDIERADDVMRFPVKEPRGAQNAALAATRKLAGQVRLDHVTFAYGEFAPPAVRDISFEVSPGSLIALVGPSGCGKSTVARIVSGQLDPQEGGVFFDGMPAESIPAEVLRASISTVNQRARIFSGTVRDNVTLWSPAILESDVMAALRDACLYDDICEKPGALDYLLAEGGANISGGQRQRLEIARALATNPSVLVLDEATSALDEATERQVIDNILRRGCSCIVIAHRPGAMRASDQVLFMEEGAVVERGSHEQLTAQSGRYAQVTNAGRM